MNQRKKKLIPFEKNKRVIRLEVRGKERVLVPGVIVFGILAVLCILYCLAIRLFIGFGTNFYYIWGVMGLGFGLISLLCGMPAWRRRIPLILQRIFWVCFGIGVALLLFVEALVISGCSAKGTAGADYVIVLGAQWKTSGPSRVLKYRLDKAVEYLRENPDTRVIVSGGKGANEPIAEAEGMYGYLVDRGIEASKIQKEVLSTNTYENLIYSGELLDKENAAVVIITNDFHVYRSQKLAKAQGYRNATGLAARSFLPMQPNNLFREFFGVMKDFLMGNFVDRSRFAK